MRLIIRWRCGDTQADNCALLVFLLPFYSQNVTSSKRTKTLATLLSEGYVALYTGAVYLLIFDERGSFFLSLNGNVYPSGIYTANATSLDVSSVHHGTYMFVL